MKTTSSDHRYTEDIAQEYELITLAYPDFEDFQRWMVQGIPFPRRDPDAPPAAEPLRILEIGTGDGFATVKIVRAMEAASVNGVVTSVDISRNMLDKARILLEKTGASRDLVHFREADALAFLQDEPEDTFDAVVTSFTLHNFERGYREEVERRIHSVLKTGGLYTNADKYAPRGQEQFDALANHVDQFFRAFIPKGKTDLLRKWVIHNISDQSPQHVMFAHETVPRLQALGFRNVSVEHRAGLQAVLRAYKG